MNDEQRPPQEPETPQPEPAQPEPQQQAEERPPPAAAWGAPPPPAKPPRWSVRHTIIAAAIAVVAAAAVGGTVFAVSETSSDGRDGRDGRDVPLGGPEAPGEMRVGPMRGGGPMADTEHGEFQHGEVTEISEDSITAKSEDGYTRTYVIDPDTEMTDGIEKGDEVMITATTSEDDEATAVSISEPGEGPLPRREDRGGN
jgi:hypothetical protein